MFVTTPLTFYVLALPLLLLAAALLLSNAAAGLVRRQACLLLLGTCLLSLLATFAFEHPATLTSGLILFATLAMLGAFLIALPLIDRARAPALVIFSALGGIAALCIFLQYLRPHLPMLPNTAVLSVLLVAALMAGGVGSMFLPLHPTRFTPQGEARWQRSPQGLLLAAWMVLAFGIASLSTLLQDQLAPPLSVWMSALAAALFTLAFTHWREDGLQKAGEALAAGVTIAASAPMPLAMATLAGIAAGFFVTRSEAMTQAVHIDDAPHLVGALFIPAMLGLLMPGLLDSLQLATCLQWLGAALGLGLGLGLLLWPLAMLSLGFALPERVLRSPQ